MATRGEKPELKATSDSLSPQKDVKPLSVRTLSDSDIVVITKDRLPRRLSEKPTKSGSLDISPLSMSNAQTPPPPPTTPDQSPFKDIIMGRVEEKEEHRPHYYRGESREQLISRLKHISMVSLSSSVDSIDRLPSDIKAVLEKDPDKLSPNRLTRGVVKALKSSRIVAYRISGWHKTRKCVVDLYHNYQLVKDADELDEKELLKDKNNDGITDVLQLSDEEYVLRKVDIVLRVVHPQQVFDAISGISVGFFAVVATLKLKTARAVTLGTSLGNMFQLVVTRVFLSDLQDLFGEYREWVLPLIHYTASFIGVLFAYTLYMIISSFHCSVRGASLVVHGVAILNARFFKSNAVVPHVDEIHADPKWAGFTVFLGTIGFLKQFTDGFVIKPWVLKLMLSPFLFAEYALWAIVLNSN
eukprot:jgi/Bigna1/136872/aug1.36_g11580